tara:strand:+ start:68 stop:1141 length:1074 start_codon:yes stop_codon:yes gene_type:complete
MKNQDYYLNNVNKNFLWKKLKYSLGKYKFNYENLRNSKILITGGTGYVGSWIVHALAAINEREKLNIKITLITAQKKNLNKYFYLNKKIKVNYIFSHISKIDKYTDKTFTHLIHAAAKYKADSAEIYNTNIVGGKKIISLIKKNKIKNVIFISSGAVYEFKNRKEKPKENFKKINLKNKNSYALSKYIVEKLFLKLAKKNKTNLTILRLFSFVGPGTSTLRHLAYTSIIDAKCQNKNIKLESDGNSYRSFMHSIDMVCWIIKSLFINKINIINVGSNEEIKIIDMAKIISKSRLLNLKKVKVIKHNNSENNSYYVPNIAKALKNKYYLFHNLNQAIKDDIKQRIIFKDPHRYYFNEE